MPLMPEAPPTPCDQALAETAPTISSAFARYFERLVRSLSRETTSGRFIPEVDGLRFIAIGMVVLFHLNAYLTAKTGFYEHRVSNRDWLFHTALVGFHGVELFFVISGFILALPFAAHRLTGEPVVGLRKYYLRRLTRLEPPYFITLFLLMFLGLFFAAGSVSDLGPHLAASLFYLHNLIYGAPSTVLGVAWSLEIEVQFYVLVPVLTLLFTIRNTALRRLVIAGLALLVMATHERTLPQDPRLALSIAGYLQFFLMGFLLADVFLLDWRTPTQWPVFWDVVALAGWPLLFFSLQSETLTHWLFPLLALVLCCAAFRGRWTRRILSCRWVTAIGGMCYSVYLIHYAVISAVGRFTKVVGEGLPNPLYFSLQAAIVSLAIIVVGGSYFLVLEKPCMRRDWPQRLSECVRDALTPRHTREAEVKVTFAD
jgi:peptidoglycan/LPS O-acetylase OafA/YrhL